MMEMRFFFQHTDYSTIRQHLADSAYQDRRERRSFDRDFSHHSRYSSEEESDSEMDPDIISARAKKQALIEYNGEKVNIPDSLQEEWEQLHILLVRSKSKSK